MQTYQIKVLPRDTFLYGGQNVVLGNQSLSSLLILKNDRFGEDVQLTAVRQKPTQQEETFNLGILQPNQVLSLNLQFVLRIGAKTLSPNFDSVVSCTIVEGSQ